MSFAERRIIGFRVLLNQDAECGKASAEELKSGGSGESEDVLIRRIRVEAID